MTETDVLQFMVVRAPIEQAGEVAGRNRVRDRTFSEHGKVERDLFSPDSTSEIGKKVYTGVFCTPPTDPNATLTAQIEQFVDELVAALPSVVLTCPDAPTNLGLELLGQRSSILRGGAFHLLPREFDGVPDDVASQVRGLVGRMLPEVAVEREGAAVDVAVLTSDLATLLGVATLETAVFDGVAYATWFATARAALFDQLYVLYILRRAVGVDLEPVMNGLRALHALEVLAIDALVARLETAHAIAAADQPLVDALAHDIPALAAWDATSVPSGFPQVGTRKALTDLLSATPVVHPLFARLHRFRSPFNDVAPVGIGDLKVVKQRLLRYTAGEISRIENVMPRESLSHQHRVLERSEDVFSSSTEQSSENQRDLQTTDRFELKQEADQVVKTDTALNAGLSVNTTFSGTGYSVVAGVTGGFSQNRSQTDTSKLASTFARDVIDKAVKRVQTKVSQSRTTTTTFETEDTDRHAFDNTLGVERVTGIYRWVDKEYESRIYNYGKRMMFEFVLPEPAGFYVESRLRAFQAHLDVPQPPTAPTYSTVPAEVVNLVPDQITPKKFRELQARYPLSDFVYPTLKKRVTFVNDQSGRNYFSEHGLDSSTWQARSFSCRLNAKDYVLKSLIMEGYVHFWGTPNSGGVSDESDNPAPNDINTMEVRLAGDVVYRKVDNSSEKWYFGNDPQVFAVSNALPMTDDTVSVDLGFWDIADFDLSFNGELELSPDRLEDWQMRVCNAVRAAEQTRVDAENNDLRQSYQSQMATYRNRIAQLEATDVNTILQGQSEAANRQVVMQELKRQCLAMLTREFDADLNDDLLTDLDATADRAVDFKFRRMDIVQKPDATSPTSAAVDYRLAAAPAAYPVPDHAKARQKGRYVQFLEQAFEWAQLSYICYPYFWAATPEWVQLMNREDPTDPFFSDFLQAGSVRVLLAVTPAFGDAVLHYLATGEPWEGGSAPVIGDPLHVPLHEELRKQQDDLEGAVPEGEPWRFTMPTSLLWLQPDGQLNPPDTGGGSPEPVAGLWTGSAHQDTASVLATDQTAWLDWPSAATWEVDVPDWATDVDVNFVLNPGVVAGSVWGELRLILDGEAGEPTMFDVNYTPDVGHFPEQAVMIVGGTRTVAERSRGKRVTVTLQGHMLNPGIAPGRLEADRGCYINGQLNFKRHTA